ncbi:MAG: DEAD/DEAH box helicase [Candidatus Limnocylindrales bacterium]|nr:DEAD/DEAH box helicase [Candidatus Limnocylindrales bacterium]
MSFDHLGLSPELLRAVANQGYTEPTPVQTEAIPLVLAGRDLLAGAQTGTGKTAAFVLPMLQRLHASRPIGPRVIRALILAPTRELALQVEESVRTYGAQNPIRSTTIYGGVGFDPQVRALRAGPEIVVATPGRLLDHLGQRTIDLSHVEILVLDEADRMLDMGFIRDIRKVLAVLPPRRQNLLFSATFSDEIRRLADGLLDRPASVQVSPRNKATDLVTQVVHPVDRERKRELLSHLIRTGRIDQALVFTRTKHGANRLATQLEHDGILATAIHGNKSQPQRVRALADFKAGRFAVLVATEVAARGLDIDALPHVVNFELPMVPEDYIHRIGRTGRAGVDGDAVSLVCVDEMRMLRDIERVLGHAIQTEVIEGFEPDPRIRPEPILRGGLGGARPGGPRPSGAPRFNGSPRPGGSPLPGGSPANRSPRSNGAPWGPGVVRSNGAPRNAGAERRLGPNRPSGAPHPINAQRSGGGPRQGGTARSGAPGRPVAGAGFARPRRPGQGIGNGLQGGTGYGPRPDQRPTGRPTGGQARPDWTRGPQRHAGPGIIIPGERLARDDG